MTTLVYIYTFGCKFINSQVINITFFSRKENRTKSSNQCRKVIIFSKWISQCVKMYYRTYNKLNQPYDLCPKNFIVLKFQYFSMMQKRATFFTSPNSEAKRFRTFMFTQSFYFTFSSRKYILNIFVSSWKNFQVFSTLYRFNWGDFLRRFLRSTTFRNS